MNKLLNLKGVQPICTLLRKIPKFMRITLVLLLVFAFQINAEQTYSQSAKISLDITNTSVEKVLHTIEEKSDFYFLYSNRLIDVDRTVSVKVDNQSISSILDQLFASDDVEYEVKGTQIILSPKQQLQDDVAISVAQQQGKTITGTIVDQQGVPVIGANIIEKGTSNGTVTDFDGNFTLNVADDAVLRISYIGYLEQEVATEGKNSFDIVMMEDTKTLEEVVVVGYGSMEKREVTSSITSITSEDLIPGTSGDPLLSMQGKVTGLSIQSNSGSSPNSSTSIQLRGVASILSGQGPLVVIDGIPGGNISSVSSEDIKSIDVLKDASAGAIYGTRAAGGVILITTKQAKEGKIRLTYSTELSTETILRKPNVLSAEEFIENGLGEDHGNVTDWYDEVTVDFPFSHRHHINLSGGSRTSKIYASFVTNNQEGIGLGDSRQEIGGRINANFSLFDGIAEVITHLDYRTSESERSNNGIFNQALKLNPTLTPYDDSQVHGYDVWTGGWERYNPVADIALRDDTGKNYNFLGDVTLKINLTEHLRTQAMMAVNTHQWRDVYYESAQHKNSLDNNRDGYASQSYGNRDDKTFEWLVNYDNRFGDHKVSAVGGYSFQEFNGDGFSMNNSDFPVDGINAWDMGKGTFLSEGKAGMGSWKDSRQRLIAFFGRINYSLMDKYMISVSARQEGSSKFHKDNRWGLFPAISGGWRISDESFMENIDFVDDLKIRGGYGVTGNQSFAPGVATRMYSSDEFWKTDGEWIYTYGTAHNQNKDLQWEEKKEWNIGLDFSLFGNKISGKFDIYERTVDKMIYDISVSVPPAIHDKTTMNVGSLRNRGWEAELSYTTGSNNNWGYSSTLRASHNSSLLKNLWGNQTYWDRVGFPAPGSPGNAVRLYPGENIGKFYVWKFAGFTDEGNWMLYDKDGEVFDVTEQTKKNEDKYFVGNAIPTLQLSWDHAIAYKNWELNMFFTSWLGHDVFNTIDMYYGLPNVDEQNVLKDAFEKNKNVVGEKELSDYWIESADFFKLKALTLRYHINTNGVNFLENANISLTGKNLFTITGYSGMDPESNINGLDPGFEWFNNIYPRTREWTLGIQLYF